MPSCRIDLWYGQFQVFGRPGTSQHWINLPGNVQGPRLTSLSYRLNGGARRRLSIGPDGRRLASPGDFNIDIAKSDLRPGLNIVEVIARPAMGQKTVEVVEVDWQGQIWPLPYQVDWRTVENIWQAVEVIDGKWQIDDGHLHPTVLAYDRAVAIGDVGWRDYEITVPITVSAVDPAGFNTISHAPGVGVRLRWTGHTEIPYSYKKQPLFGWLPVGASAWYDFGSKKFKLHLNARLAAEDATSGPIEVGSTWIFKARVETMTTGQPKCRFKFWPADRQEPSSWGLCGIGEDADPQTGAVILIAHHVDAHFGNLHVVPVSADRPLISHILSPTWRANPSHR